MKFIISLLVISCVSDKLASTVFCLKKDIYDEKLNLNDGLSLNTFDGDFTNYLEETNHNLIGYGTPMFISRLVDGYVKYDRAYYPKESDKKIRYYQERIETDDSKTQTNKAKSKKNRSSKSKRGFVSNNNTVEIVYPEILVVVDYETYKFHNESPVKIATYISALMNGVDLRFRELRDPQVRLNIAGLVINKDKNTEPYLKRDGANGYFRNLRATLLAIGEHFNNYKFSYDAVVVLTHRGLTQNGPLEMPSTSFWSSACKRPKSTAIARDMGGFEGIMNVVHELGHIFGASDDNVRCPSFDYIMDNKPSFRSNMHWSNCSQLDIIDYLRSMDANCLRNKPDVVLAYRKKLPGKLLTRDQQCGTIFADHVAKDSNRCDTLQCEDCFLKVFCSDATINSPPAEGSSCGDGQFCIDGNCIQDPKIFDEF